MFVLDFSSTSTNLPDSQLHHEMSKTPQVPRNVFANVCTAGLWCVLSISVPTLIMTHTQRPIPYQKIYLNDTFSIVTRDQTINYEYLDDSQVSVGLIFLLAVGFIMPLLIIFLVGWVFPIRCGSVHDQDTIVLRSSSFRQLEEQVSEYDSIGSEDPHAAAKVDTFNAWSSFMYAVGTTEFLTSFVKYYVGRLRPNFYAMCKWSDELLACTEPSDFVQAEARKSFPSGHSSLAFCGCTFVTLYLNLKLTVNIIGKDNTLRPFTKDMLNLLVFFIPLSFSWYIAASRVHDNWHHVGDVLAGSLIGATTSAFCFARLYLTKRIKRG